MALIYATCFSKSDDQSIQRNTSKILLPQLIRYHWMSSSYISPTLRSFPSTTMRRVVIFQLLVLNFRVLIGCKALPPGLILTSRHYHETSLGHHTLVKRANGQDLWDNLQIRLACGAEDDVKETQDDISKSEKFNLYAPFTKPF